MYFFVVVFALCLVWIPCVQGFGSLDAASEESAGSFKMPWQSKANKTRATLRNWETRQDACAWPA